MKNQQSFSHGLLYSVAPENFSALHLKDEDGHGEFDWLANEFPRDRSSFAQAILDLLKPNSSK